MKAFALPLAAVLLAAGAGDARAETSAVGGDRPELADRFISCSAWLLVDALLAREADRPDLEQKAHDTARGWRAGAAALLDDGAQAPGAFERLLATVDARIEARLQAFGRALTADPERLRAAARLDFERVCVPLASLQARLVEQMTKAEPNRTGRNAI